MIASVLIAVSIVFHGGSQRRFEYLDPKTYVSPSGHYRLRVNPTNEDGGLDGDYTLRKDGRALWSKRLPSTLWNAVLLDSGFAVGYSYQYGYEGFRSPKPSDRSSGTFDIVLVGPDGRYRVLRSFPRAYGRGLHEPPLPIASEIRAAPREGWVTVRLVKANAASGSESLKLELPETKVVGGSTQFHGPILDPGPPPKRPSFRPIELRKLPTVVLGSEVKGSLDIGDLEFAGAGRIAYLDYSHPMVRLTVIDYEGKQLQAVDLPFGPDSPTAKAVGPAWIGGTRFVVARSVLDIGGSATGWVVDSKLRSVTKLKGFRCPPISEIDGYRDGTFAVLTEVHSQYSLDEGIAVFDASGRQVWANRGGGGFGPDDGPEKLFSPADITFTAKGQIAVIDAIKSTIQVFSKSGKYERTLDLGKTLKKELIYSANIEGDDQGGFVFIDDDVVYRLDSFGKILSSWKPRHANGVAIEPHQVSSGSGGIYWMSDRFSIIGFASNGKLKKVFGGAPNPNVLREVGDMKVDGQGRILAADLRTSAIHVFDGKGNRLFVCVPKDGVRGGSVFPPRVEYGPDGELFLTGAKLGDRWGWLRFDAKGNSKGMVFESDRAGSVNLTKAYRWSNNRLVDRAGNTLRKIERNADGTWFKSWNAQWSQGKEGTLGMFASTGYGRSASSPKLSVYSKTGEPLSGVSLSEEFEDLTAMCFDGGRFYLLGKSSLYCLKPNGGGIWKFKISQIDRISHMVLLDGGRSIGLFEHPKSIRKYALP